jgi:HEAT repeat protein
MDRTYSPTRWIALGTAIACFGAAAVIWRLTSRDSGGSPDEMASEIRKLEDARDVVSLAQEAKHADASRATLAVRALGTVGGAQALAEALCDPRAEIRAAAVSRLGDLADPANLPQLAGHLRDGRREVRIAALRGIAQVRDFSMFDSLVLGLHDPDPMVRRLAHQTLEERIGAVFAFYDPDASEPARSAAIARIKERIPGYRRAFDDHTETLKRLGSK